MAIKRLDHINVISHDIKATQDFYCSIIGLVTCSTITNNSRTESVDLYIPGQDIAVIHVRSAKRENLQPNFEVFASLDENNNGRFSTGALDHFCLMMDAVDYPLMLSTLKENNINFQTYDHGNNKMKQIWVLDPNGIRVELSYLDLST